MIRGIALINVASTNVSVPGRFQFRHALNRTPLQTGDDSKYSTTRPHKNPQNAIVLANASAICCDPTIGFAPLLMFVCDRAAWIRIALIKLSLG